MGAYIEKASIAWLCLSAKSILRGHDFKVRLLRLGHLVISISSPQMYTPAERDMGVFVCLF